MIGMVSGPLPLNRSMILNRKFFLISISLIFFLEIDLLGQDLFEFDDTRSSVFSQSVASSIEIGDITGDGVNDVIISGYNFGNEEGLFLDIYSVSSTGSIDTLQIDIIKNYFTYIPENHSSYYIGGDGGVEIGDYDRDGLIDILVHGAEFSFLTKNLGGNVSLNNYLPSEVREGLGESSLKWGDVDLDGDLDIFWIGLINGRSNISNRLLINNSNYQEDVEWEFDETMVMPDLRNGTVAWSDIDLDGDLDILASGQQLTVESGVTKLYLNNPIGRLGVATTQEIAALKGTAVCFADLDNDADNDLIISGYSPIDSSLKTLIYVNEPTGNFRLADEQINFGTIFGTIEAIDINLDGYKDIAISGATGHSINYDTFYLIDPVVNDQGDTLSADTTIVLMNARDSVWAMEGRVYLNSGNNEIDFSEAQTINGARTISFVDIDQDGKPDIISSGTTEIGEKDSSFVSVYMNTTNGVNNAPEPPDILESFAISNRVIFNWGNGSDDIGSAQSLRYNLSISRSISESNDVNLLSDEVSFNNSNIGQKLIREFTNIPWGTYIWKVQAVDASGLVSEWSQEKELFIPRLVNSVQSIPGYSYGISRWSDINDDGLLDLAITGNLYTGTSETQIFINDDGILSVDNLQSSMNNVYGGHLSFVDYTNDGHLDISMTGLFTIELNTMTVALLYKWQNGEYALDNQVNQLSADNGYWGGQYNHDWGDYDNDGDLDLVSGGISTLDGQNYLNIYNNNKGLLSQDTIQNDLVPLFPCATIWININGDSHLDLITLGRLGTIGVSYMYINDGDGNMVLDSNQVFDIPSVLHAISSADFNSDGYEDLAVSHLDGTEMHTNIYSNDAGNGFNLYQQLEGTTYASLDWGDYDNDGDLDLISSGYTGIAITELNETEYTNPITNVYQQGSDGIFLMDSSLYMLDSVGLSSTQWGDYDNDGDLDLLVTGETSTDELVTKVYENLEGFTNPNVSPSKPMMLISSVNIDTVNISWQSGIDIENLSGSGKTPDQGMKYQLQMGEDQNYNLGGNTHSIINMNILSPNQSWITPIQYFALCHQLFILIQSRENQQF